MDDDWACTDALKVGGYIVCVEACDCLQVERTIEQILAVVAETQMKLWAL